MTLKTFRLWRHSALPSSGTRRIIIIPLSPTLLPHVLLCLLFLTQLTMTRVSASETSNYNTPRKPRGDGGLRNVKKPPASSSSVSHSSFATNNDTAATTSSTIIMAQAEATSDFELSCPGTLRVPQQIEWYKQNPSGQGKKLITQFRHRYELTNFGRVRIHMVSNEDGGMYYCQLVVNNATSPTTNSTTTMNGIHLVITDASPSESSSPSSSSSSGGKRKNNHLKSSHRRKISPSERTYSEPQILRSHLPKEQVQYVAKGVPVLLLKCESSGNPSPTVTWTKDGKIISTSSSPSYSSSSVSSAASVATLKLINVSQADGGQYKCEAVNIFGISTYQLMVQVTDYWFGAAEIVDLTPKNVTATAGTSVSIVCKAKFELEPWFAWVRKVVPKTDIVSGSGNSGKVFYHGGTGAYYEVLKSSVTVNKKSQKGADGSYFTQLTLSNLTNEDSGTYFCAVAGLQGYNLSEAVLTVVPDPKSVAFSSSSSASSLAGHVRGVASAQWAILWTISFIFLVMIVILCFVKLYRCRRSSKPNRSLYNQHRQQQPNCWQNIPTDTSSSTNKPKCQMPDSSPLTMSTNCNTTTNSNTNTTTSGAEEAHFSHHHKSRNSTSRIHDMPSANCAMSSCSRPTPTYVGGSSSGGFYFEEEDDTFFDLSVSECGGFSCASGGSMRGDHVVTTVPTPFLRGEDHPRINEDADEVDSSYFVTSCYRPNSLCSEYARGEPCSASCIENTYLFQKPENSLYDSHHDHYHYQHQCSDQLEGARKQGNGYYFPPVHQKNVFPSASTTHCCCASNPSYSQHYSSESCPDTRGPDYRVQMPSVINEVGGRPQR